MHALDSITVSGFRSIASIKDLKLGATNVIIGPNGSGKSNFIDVLIPSRPTRGTLAGVRRAGGRR